MAHKEPEVIVRKCYDCGGTMHGTRTYYKYTECGLDSVTLENIMVFRCSGCGAIVPQIPAIGELHRTIVLGTIQKETLLSGQEIRFLRKMAGLNGKELSSALGANQGSLSKWENGSRKISKKADAAVRLICFAGMLQDILRDRQLLPAAAEISKKLSEVDIRAILTRIRDIESGSVKMTIDPTELAKLGDGTNAEIHSKQLVQ